MKFIKIGKNKIGLKFKPYVIVEACVNHQGNFNIAKKMILFAKKSWSSMYKISTSYC